MESKTCKLCREELPISNFWRNPSVKDGYFNKCKVCATKVKDINVLKKQLYIDQNLWTCSTCNETLPLSTEFFHRRNDSETGFQHRCKKCLKKDPNRYDRLIKKDDLRYYLKDRMHGAKFRSNKRNLEFSITLNYLLKLWEQQEGFCNLTGLKMTHSILEGKIKTNLSIDRINPKLGYVENNVQLVCNVANVMKSNLSIEELIDFCKLIIEKNNG